MQTLWPRTDPLLAEVFEPSRSAGGGHGSEPAGLSPYSFRGLARPVAPRRDPPRRWVVLLEGWLQAVAIGVLARTAAVSRTGHPLGPEHHDPGAPGTPGFECVPRPGLEARRRPPVRRCGAPHHERVPCPTRRFRRPMGPPRGKVHSRHRLLPTMREGQARRLPLARTVQSCAGAGAAARGVGGTAAAPGWRPAP